MTYLMVKGKWDFLMETNMMVNGKMTKSLVKVFTFTKIEICTKALFIKIKSQDLENFSGWTEIDT